METYGEGGALSPEGLELWLKVEVLCPPCFKVGVLKHPLHPLYLRPCNELFPFRSVTKSKDNQLQ